MIAYLKYGAIAALVLALFGGGFYLGGLKSKAALEGFEAAQTENTAKAVLAERASAAVEQTRVATKLKEFEDAPIDPIVPGIAHRVFLAARPTSCPLSSPSPVASGATTPSGVSSSDREVELATQNAFDAGARDAQRLDLCRAVWPHH
jgi:hypothetical protein